MKVGVEFLLNIWNFSSSTPPTSKICMGFGKQIRNRISHRYFKNARLNGESYDFGIVLFACFCC